MVLNVVTISGTLRKGSFMVPSIAGYRGLPPTTAIDRGRKSFSSL
jgi:hypothetical protein